MPNGDRPARSRRCGCHQTRAISPPVTYIGQSADPGGFLPTYPPPCCGSSRHPSRAVGMWTARKSRPLATPRPTRHAADVTIGQSGDEQIHRAGFARHHYQNGDTPQVVTDPAGAGGMFVTNSRYRFGVEDALSPTLPRAGGGAVCRPAQRATSPCTPRHVAVLHTSPQTAATSADCTQPGRLVHARCPRRWRWRKAALPLRSRRGRLVVPPAAAVGRSRSAPALGGMSSSSGGVAPLRTFRLP